MSSTDEEILLHDTAASSHHAKATYVVSPDTWYQPPAVAVDCLYNTRRSTPIAMVTFAFVVTCALTLVVFSLQTATDDALDLRFMDPPAATTPFGLAWANFSVLVTKGTGKRPAARQPVTVAIFPISPIDLQMAIPPEYSQERAGRIDCLAIAHGTDKFVASQLGIICNTTMPYLQGATTVYSDEKGIAQFSGIRLTHGYPTRYLLGITLGKAMESTTMSISNTAAAGTTAPPRSIRTVVTLTAPQIILSTPTIQLLADEPTSLQNYKVTARVTVDVASLLPIVQAAEQSTFDQLRSLVVASRSGLSQLEQAEEQAAANETLGKLRTLQDIQTALTLDAHIVPLDIRNAKSDRVYGSVSFLPLLASLRGSTARVGQLVQVTTPGTRRGDSAKATSSMVSTESTLFQGEVVFDQLALLSSSEGRVFLGLYILGSVVPIPAISVVFRGAAPPNVLSQVTPGFVVLPFLIDKKTSLVNISDPHALVLRAVTSAPSSSSATPPSPTEQRVSRISTDVTIGATLLVEAPAGTPTSRQTYFFLLPLPGFASDYGHHLLYAPLSKPLQLLNPTASITVGQSKTWKSAFGAKGVSGDYAMIVACDGETSEALLVTVESDVSTTHSSLKALTDPWTKQLQEDAVPTEVVGATWNTVPSIRVMSEKGLPLPGKFVTSIELLGDTSTNVTSRIRVVYLADASDADGWIVFQFLMVPFLPENAVSGSLLTFAFRVDNVFVGLHTLRIEHSSTDMPAGIPGCIPVPLALSPKTKSAEPIEAEFIMVTPRGEALQGTLLAQGRVKVRIQIAAPMKLGMLRNNNNGPPTYKSQILLDVDETATFSLKDYGIFSVPMESTARIFMRCEISDFSTSHGSEPDLETLVHAANAYYGEAPTQGIRNSVLDLGLDEDQSDTVEGGDRIFFPIVPIALAVAPRVEGMWIEDRDTAAQCSSGQTCTLTYTMLLSERFDPQYPPVATALPVMIPHFAQSVYTAARGQSALGPIDFILTSTQATLTGKISVTAHYRPSPDIHGPLFFMGQVDGMTFPFSLKRIDVVSPVQTLTLVQSMQWGALAGKTSFGPSFRQPHVLVRDASNRPIANASVYAQLVFPGDAVSNVLQDINTAINGSMMHFLDQSLQFPVAISDPSDSNGLAVFTGIGLMGVVPDVPFRVRYGCAGKAFVFEPKSFVSSADISVVVLNAPSFGVPGVPLGSVQAQTTGALSGASMGFLSARIQGGSVDALLTGDNSFTATSSVINLAGISLETTATEGTYEGQVIVPGAASQPFLIEISSQPNSMQVITEPKVNVLIGGTLTPIVRVMSNGVGVPNAVVTVKSESSGRACSGGEDCGILAGNVAQTTDGFGYASFVLSFTAAPEGLYKLKFKVSRSADSKSAEVVLANAAQAAAISLGAQGTSASTAQLPSFLSGTVAGLFTAASELLSQILPDPTTVEESSSDINVYNEVVRVDVLQTGQLSTLNTNLPVALSVQPIVRLLDRFGEPVANRSVEIFAQSGGLVVQSASIESSYYSSDSNGTIRFLDLRIIAAPIGSWSFVVSAKGTRSNTAASGIIEAEPALSMDTQMQVVSFVATAIMLPLLVANVPFSSWRWVVLSVASLLAIVLLAITQFGSYLTQTQNRYVAAFIYLVIVLFGLMVVALIALAVQHIRRMMQMKRPQGVVPIEDIGADVDNHDPARRSYEYTKWLIAARRPKEQTLLWYRTKLNNDIKATKLYKLQEKLESKGIEFFQPKKLFTIYDDVRLPPLEPPKEIDPNHIPIKFYIVISLATVMYAVLVMLSLYAVERFKVWLESSLLILPTTGTGGDQTMKMTQQSLKEMLNFVVKNAPSLSQLKTVLDPLIQYNLLEVTTNVAKAINEMLDAMPIALVTAHVLSALSLLGVLVRMYFSIPKLLLAARRGEYRRLYKKAEITKGDEYIGMHCILFVAQHQLIYWVVFLCALIISISAFREFMWSQLSFGVFLTLAIATAKDMFQKTVIAQFIVDGLDVKRPLFYSLYAVYAAIMGVFSGLIGCVQRFFMCLAGIIFLFPLIDFNLIPREFEKFDDGYVKFYSMIITDAQVNNPIVLTALGVFLCDGRLKRQAEIDATNVALHGETETQLLFTSESFGTRGIGNVVHAVRFRFRALHAMAVKESQKSTLITTTATTLTRTSASAGALVSVKYRHARRWWLLYLLHQNPSIRGLRKHALERGCVLQGDPTPVYEELSPTAAALPAGNKRSRSLRDDLASQELSPVTSGSFLSTPGNNKHASAATPHHHHVVQPKEEEDPFFSAMNASSSPSSGPFAVRRMTMPRLDCPAEDEDDVL